MVGILLCGSIWATLFPVCRARAVFKHIFFSTHTELTASGGWGDFRWIWQKDLYCIRIVYPVFNLILSFDIKPFHSTMWKNVTHWSSARFFYQNILTDLILVCCIRDSPFICKVWFYHFYGVCWTFAAYLCVCRLFVNACACLWSKPGAGTNLLVFFCCSASISRPQGLCGPGGPESWDLSQVHWNKESCKFTRTGFSRGVISCVSGSVCLLCVTM